MLSLPIIAMLTGLLAVATFSTFVGMRLARVRSHLWLLGFFLPLALVCLVIVGRRMPQSAFVFPMSFVTHYKVTPWLMAATVPVLLATLAGRLQRRGQRIAVYGFMVVMTAYFAWLPVVAPLVGQMRLRGNTSVIDAHGNCRQTSEFSCGAAAAVTALGRLGIMTDEATVAREALTGPAVGTDPVALTDALNRVWGPLGVFAQYRRVERDRDLLGHFPVILEIHTGPLTNHYIAVVGAVTDAKGFNYLVIADPDAGMQMYSLGMLSGMWHGTGIFLTRTPVTLVRAAAGAQVASR